MRVNYWMEGIGSCLTFIGKYEKITNPQVGDNIVGIPLHFDASLVVTCIFVVVWVESVINLAPVRPLQQQFMKFTPIFAGSRYLPTEKPLYNSASSKVLLREEDFEPAEVVQERVVVSTSELGQQLRHYQWRNRTEFPIVRVTTCQVLHSSEDRVQLQILRQSIPLLLAQLTDLPLFRVLYLLKETLIGCERLFARFGPFRINAQMVGVNHAHKCRVWINENLASNVYQHAGLDEKGLVGQVIDMFQQKTLKGKTMASFYGDLQKCSSFASALAFIQHYTKQNKIAIPSFFKSDKLTQNKNHTGINKFQPNLTMTRSPRFINTMRDTMTPLSKQLKILPPVQAKQKEEMKQQGKQTLLQLKKSAQTRADVYGSGTMTLTDSKSRQDLLDHHFLSAQEIPLQSQPPAQKMQKSQFLQFKSKGQRHQKPTHRVTNRDLFSCFTPQPQTHHQHQQWDMGNFLSPSYEQKQKQRKQVLQDQLQSLFERNHWQQRIQGLFGGQTQLKRSVHAGEPKWRKNNHEQELSLLQNFGKSVFESCLHQQR